MKGQIRFLPKLASRVHERKIALHFLATSHLVLGYYDDHCLQVQLSNVIWREHLKLLQHF